MTAAPFDAPRGVGYVPARDATAAIQRALDRAAAADGGIVYLPAGWYRIESGLRVPANVELRGASAVPNRDQLGLSGGTVLLAYDGRGTAQPDTAPALVTLDGARAGVRGLRVFYPENNPASAEGLVPYPYAIRGNGEQTYVVNVGLPNAWNGVDMSDPGNARFVVRKVAGAVLSHVVTVGRNTGGRIEGLLSNGNAVTRVGYALPHWANEGSIFPQVIDKYMRKQAQLVTVDGARRLTVFDVFGYGFHHGLVVEAGEVTAFDVGTDNLGDGGNTVRVREGDVTAVNVLRYNGSTSTGPARLTNIMAINMRPARGERGRRTCRGRHGRPHGQPDRAGTLRGGQPGDGHRRRRAGLCVPALVRRRDGGLGRAGPDLRGDGRPGRDGDVHAALTP